MEGDTVHCLCSKAVISVHFQCACMKNHKGFFVKGFHVDETSQTPPSEPSIPQVAEIEIILDSTFDNDIDGRTGTQ